MERIEKIITDTEVVYKAIDGTEFEYKYECIEYEYFLEHQEDILSKIIFYKEKDGIFTQITVDELDYFDYCYLTDDTYIKYHKYFNNWNEKYQEKVRDFHQLVNIGIYKRDYSEAFNGGYGWNGWKYIGRLDQIKLWENLRKTIDKPHKV